MKLVVACVAMFSFTGLPYVLLGIWNRVMGGWVLVFYCYAGSPDFVTRYALPPLARLFRWRPALIGVLQQDGRWGVVLASSATEVDFVDPSQAAAFLRLKRRIAWIARVTGARDIHLAGVLPSLVGCDGPVPLAQTRPQVVAAVRQAATEVVHRHLPPDTRDVIVLGGAGFIGRAVVEAMTQDGWNCYVVDPKVATSGLPSQLQGQPALLLDVARKGAIGPYIDQMWPGLVVLNEVFPAPSQKLVRQMLAKDVPVLHLAGVAGRVIPSFPDGYEGAVPCCASRPTPGTPQVVIRDMAQTLRV